MAEGTGLNEDDVLMLLKAGSEPDEIAAELQKKGYAGSRDADTLKSLRNAGAKPSLILAIAKVPGVKPAMVQEPLTPFEEAFLAEQKEWSKKSNAKWDVEYIEKLQAAKRGDAEMQNELIRFYLKAVEAETATQDIRKIGNDPDRNIEGTNKRIIETWDEIVKWCRKGVERGDPYEQIRLGRFYEDGVGRLEKSRTEALKWYRKAAAQGMDVRKDIERLSKE